MQKAFLIRGRLVNPTIVELAEPVPDPNAEVEVIVRALEPPCASKAEDLVAFLRSLPPGTRTKEDIDQQVREER